MRGKRIRLTLWLLFGTYAVLLLLLLFVRRPRTGHEYNLIPFATIRDYFLVMRMRNPWEASLRTYGWVNFLGNIFAFVPLGLFLPLLFKRQRNIWLFLLTVVLAVCGVELLQLWTRRGSLDVDDLILNVPGACLGWLGWRLWQTKKNHGNAS